MAVDNDTKLTKFKSATTIVTADYANSIFGGLYGSSEADNLHPDDPRITGHVHDGIKADGHASKIDLVDHVENQLLNINLADDAVTKRNVRETLYQSEAIPEYEIIDGVTYYYLDLTGIRTDFTFIEDDAPSSADSGISENILIRQRSQTYDGTSYVDIPDVWGTATGRDFVFGSPSLEDINDGTDGNSRFLFDKSLSAFRAGSVNSTQWDEANRGQFSAAFGINNTASGDGSFAAGFRNEASGINSAVFGKDNNISAGLSLISGESNSVGSEYSLVSGSFNIIAPDSSHITVGGFENSVSSTTTFALLSAVPYSVVVFGESNEVEDGRFDSIANGVNNVIIGSTPSSFFNFPNATNSILNGFDNSIDSSNASHIGNGNTNNITEAQAATILNGVENNINGSYVTKGSLNYSTSQYSNILNGRLNTIDNAYSSTIIGGDENVISASPEYDQANERMELASAFGHKSFAYAYGQTVQSSGTFDIGSAPLSSFPPSPTPNDWVALVPNEGGAQTFTMTMFGQFSEYDYNAIFLDPTLGGTSKRFVATLSNGDTILTTADRPFRPRRNSCYSIKAIGALSFSEEIPAPSRPAPATGDSIRHSITFELHSGITVQEDGSIIYATNSFLITHDSRDIYGSGALRVKAPGTTNSNDDFHIYFTHDPVTPTNQSSSVAAIIPAPGGAADHGFVFVVDNLTPTGTNAGTVLYGGALTVRLDVTEMNINIYKDAP